MQEQRRQANIQQKAGPTSHEDLITPQGGSSAQEDGANYQLDPDSDPLKGEGEEDQHERLIEHDTRHAI
jgi:hypothetical protein